MENCTFIEADASCDGVPPITEEEFHQEGPDGEPPLSFFYSSTEEYESYCAYVCSQEFPTAC